TSICSATSRLSRAFSDSRSLSRRASGTSRPPNLLRQRKKVCSVRLCFLHRALIDMAPTWASRRMPMICSSVNRFFMELSLPVKGRELTSQMATRSVSGHCHERFTVSYQGRSVFALSAPDVFALMAASERSASHTYQEYEYC